MCLVEVERSPKVCLIIILLVHAVSLILVLYILASRCMCYASDERLENQN